MKQVYITTISLQNPKFGLKKVIYHPIGFELHSAERETSFPIMPLLAEEVTHPNEIEIIAIRVKNQDAADNYEEFIREIETLGLKEACVHMIEMPENQTMDTQIQLMLDIIDRIPNHAEVRACVTFGTKPVSIITTYALNSIEKLRTDVEVMGIYYGEIVRNRGENIREGEGRLYNLIGLLQVNDIVGEMKTLQVENPEECLRKLIK